MTIIYLKNIKNRQELRRLFYTLLKKHHPDNGGDAEICKVINNEYEFLFKTLPETSGDPEKVSKEEKKATADMDKAIREMLNKIIRFDINIEVVGTWIWVDGDTFPYKEELKTAGFRWSKARQKWHACPYGEGGYYKGKKKSFQTLRNIYGSDFIETEKMPQLA